MATPFVEFDKLNVMSNKALSVITTKSVKTQKSSVVMTTNEPLRANARYTI